MTTTETEIDAAEVEATEATEEVQDDADDTEATGAKDEPTDDAKANREAASYRRQLREAEAERDALKASVAAFQRADVERLAAAKLEDAADVWREGATVEQLLAEDGTIDPAKVNALADALIEQHPHWRAGAHLARPPRARDQGRHSGRDTESPRSFSKAFAPRHDD